MSEAKTDTDNERELPEPPVEVLPPSVDGMRAGRNGGRIMERWSPGNGVGKGPAAGRTSIYAMRRRCLSIMAEASEENTKQLIRLTRDPDTRVAIAAIKVFSDIFYGKYADVMTEDRGKKLIDMSTLSDEDRGELAGALATIGRLCGDEPG